MFLRSAHPNYLVGEIMVATFALLQGTILAVRAFALQTLAEHFGSLESCLFPLTVSQSDVLALHSTRTKRAGDALDRQISIQRVSGSCQLPTESSLY